jgi:hypothetical protein
MTKKETAKLFKIGHNILIIKFDIFIVVVMSEGFDTDQFWERILDTRLDINGILAANSMNYFIMFYF